MNNIILIGFMGCGKSTVGMRLSYRLHRIVEDTDKLIEKKEGISISEIFKEKGEACFRLLETECLQELLQDKTEKIISTGGGLPVNPKNHGLLKELGQVVYLKISPETVWERLKNDTSRPLLQCENPLEKIRELLAKREACYEAAAQITILVDGKSMEQILEEIVEKTKE